MGKWHDNTHEQKPLAYGEVMVLDEKFGIRISEILTKEQLVEKFKDGLYG